MFESGFLFTMIVFPRLAHAKAGTPALGIICSSILIGLTNLLVNFNSSTSPLWFFGVFVFGGAVSLLIAFAESTAVLLSRLENNPAMIGYGHAVMFVGNLFYLALAYAVFKNGGNQTWLFAIPHLLLV